MNANDYDKYNTWGIGSLLSNWLISVGAVVVILFSGQFISKVFLPAIVFACQFALMQRARKGRENHPGYCYLLPYLMSHVLFVTAIIMVAINVYYIWFIPPQEFADGAANPSIPYITILIVAPVSSVILLWALHRGSKLRYCLRCRTDHGLPAERGFIARVSANESRYQLRILTTVSIIATIYSWTYYLVRYSNANLNTADRFYFNNIPLIFYIMSAVYLTMHYWSLYAFYQKNIAENSGNRVPASYVRFILICGDSVFLSEKNVPAYGNEPTSVTIDTPFRLNLPYRDRFDIPQAEAEFSRMLGNNAKFDIRFLYKTASPGEQSNFFHYLCSIEFRSITDSLSLNGIWYTQPQLGRLFSEHRIDLMLAGEIRRIYTMAKTFKAYDREGRRLHPIRHYSPSFSLDDLMGLKIDFNDPTWLFVAEDNEDKIFYKLRRLTRRYDGDQKM